MGTPGTHSALYRVAGRSWAGMLHPTADTMRQNVILSVL